MNNRGFIATSIIYSLFIAILLLMTFTINNYYKNENLSSAFNQKAKII